MALTTVLEPKRLVTPVTSIAKSEPGEAAAGGGGMATVARRAGQSAALVPHVDGLARMEIAGD